MTFGGYVEWYGVNRFVWGILHSDPQPFSPCEPNRLYVWDDDEEEGNYFVTCADCHGSDLWSLDSRGALHWCSVTVAASFATKIERDALSWELNKLGARELVTALPSAEFISRIVPRIAEGRVPEASDEYETLYLYGGIYAAVKGNRIKAALVNERGRSLLAGLPVSVKA
jgi:hypothetical protein